MAAASGRNNQLTIFDALEVASATEDGAPQRGNLVPRRKVNERPDRTMGTLNDGTGELPRAAMRSGLSPDEIARQFEINTRGVAAVQIARNTAAARSTVPPEYVDPVTGRAILGGAARPFDGFVIAEAAPPAPEPYQEPTWAQTFVAAIKEQLALNRTNGNQLR